MRCGRFWQRGACIGGLTPDETMGESPDETMGETIDERTR